MAGRRALACLRWLEPLQREALRAARRLTDELNGEWFALNVKTAASARLSPTQRDQLASNLQLAKALGGKSITLPGQSIADVVVKYARSHNITKIIAGKPLRSRWRELLQGSLVDQLIRSSGPIDVYAVSSSPEPAQREASRGRMQRVPMRRYLAAAGLVAGATVLGHPLSIAFTPTNLVMIYLAAVVIAAVFLGRGPAILASMLSVLAFDFFFVSPRLTFAGLLIVSLVISTLTTRAGEQAEAAMQRETETAALYELSRDLAAALTRDEILRTVIEHVEHTVRRDVVILLPVLDGDRLEVAAASASFELPEDELAVADWVYRRGEPAGIPRPCQPPTYAICR
jgi:two-component system sensor histidine kinase KdpD